mgnify:FL=1
MCLFCDVYVGNFIQLSYIFISFLIFYESGVFSGVPALRG